MLSISRPSKKLAIPQLLAQMCMTSTIFRHALTNFWCLHLKEEGQKCDIFGIFPNLYNSYIVPYIENPKSSKFCQKIAAKRRRAQRKWKAGFASPKLLFSEKIAQKLRQIGLS